MLSWKCWVFGVLGLEFIVISFFISTIRFITVGIVTFSWRLFVFYDLVYQFKLFFYCLISVQDWCTKSQELYTLTSKTVWKHSSKIYNYCSFDGEACYYGSMKATGDNIIVKIRSIATLQKSKTDISHDFIHVWCTLGKYRNLKNRACLLCFIAEQLLLHFFLVCIVFV